MPSATEPDQLPLRTCPSCGMQERTRFERCPHCLASYYATPPRLRRRRLLAGGAVGLAIAAALAVIGAIALQDHSRNEARVRAEDAKAVVALRARLRRIQAPHYGAAPQLRPPAGATDAQKLAARRRLVVAVEGAITNDARARAKAGELDGPISDTYCGPILKAKNAVPDDRVLSKHIGRYDCVAIKHHIIGIEGKKVAELGHPFVAALNFDTFNYTWCRNTPAQGERGAALVFVRLARACLAATGKALGTGYVETGG